jgi:indolepyruvate ferredoxin oxidoreductase, alpha subunit
MDFNICMGASISAGHGAQQAFDRIGSDMRVVSVLGDSTFFHTGINSLIEVLYNNSRTVNVILDNRITGMTGHQENPGSGRHADNSPAPPWTLKSSAGLSGQKCGHHRPQ